MKTCPFLNKECIKEECQIWNALNKNCSVVAVASELHILNMTASDIRKIKINS